MEGELSPGKLVLRFVLDQGLRLVGMGVMLFWPAGTLNWWPGWGLVAVSAAWIAGTAIVIVRNDPALLAERLSPPRGAKRWDAALMSVHAIVQMGIYVVGGLDHRFRWTSGMPLAAQLMGLAGCAIGYGLAVWATACNPFFSLLVRIQTERGHTVATQGPYRVVRHPAYAGAVLLGLSFGVLLGSWPAVFVGLLDSILMILRTSFEDRDLLKELPGYADYARRVGYRILPGIW